MESWVSFDYHFLLGLRFAPAEGFFFFFIKLCVRRVRFVLDDLAIAYLRDADFEMMISEVNHFEGCGDKITLS